MKSLEEFKVYFETQLKPQLEKLEAERVLKIKKVYSSVIPVAIIGLVLAIVFSRQGPASFYVALLSILTGFGIFAYQTRGYKSKFKSVVIQRLVEFVGSSLRYDESKCIALEQFQMSKLFLSRPDRYYGDDHVEGLVGETAIEFSEIRAEEEVQTSDNKTDHHTIFRGIFFIADFNKHFQGETFVLPDTSERLFGGFGKFLQSIGPSRPELVTLEDPEFEKYFVTYSSDQTEARYILSPSLILRILKFRKRIGRGIRLSFINSSLHIAVPFTKNLFEPNMFKSLLDIDPIQEYFEDLQLAIGIVEELNLNTRIWSK